MKLEDATPEWVDKVCGRTNKRRSNTFYLFHTFDYVWVKDTVPGALEKAEVIAGDTGKGSRHKPADIIIFGCDFGEIITSPKDGYNSCRERDVTKAFNQLEFPSQCIDDIIMEVAFFRSETREEVVGRFGRDLFTLLKLLRKEREKFLGGV